MNKSQFKDLISLAGVVVTSWSLTQKVADANLFTVMTNIFVTEFSENVYGILTQLFVYWFFLICPLHVYCAIKCDYCDGRYDHKIRMAQPAIACKLQSPYSHVPHG